MRTKLTTRSLRLAAVTAFASAFALAFMPGAAGAATPQRAAWWDLTPVGGGAPPPTTVPSPPPTTIPPVPETTLPAPPPLPSTTLPSAPSTTKPPTSTTVPSSKNAATLEAGSDGVQYTAIAAIQYSVPLTQSGLQVNPKSIDALLTLTVVPGASAGTPKLVACPATSNWAPGADQPAKKAPKYDCKGSHAAKGVYNAGSLTETFNLSWPQERPGHPGVFSVVILPAGKPRNAGVFTVSLKPNANSFQVLSWSPSGGAGGGGSPPPVVAPPPPPPAPGGAPVPAGVGSGSGGSPSTGFTAPTPAAPSGPSPSAVPPPSAASSASPGVPPANLGAARPASLRRTALTAGRDIGIGLLVALGLLLALSSNRTARLPRLLVPLPARVTPGEDAPPSG